MFSTFVSSAFQPRNIKQILTHMLKFAYKNGGVAFYIKLIMVIHGAEYRELQALETITMSYLCTFLTANTHRLLRVKYGFFNFDIVHSSTGFH